MKILITGINGQVGSALFRQAKTLGHEVIAISREQWDMALSPEYGEELVVKSKPDLVINPAAYTNVDGAEGDEAVASKVNADAPRALAKGCQQLDIPILHVSTDYVFDGTKEEPYVETDKTNPINAYGRTKLAGELAVQEEAQKSIILRVSWVFSNTGKNFLKTMVRLAKSCDRLTVVADQFGGPSSATAIAEVLLGIARRYENGEVITWGTYHFSQKPYVSWHQFASLIIATAREKGLFEHSVAVDAISSAAFTTPIGRPANSRLDMTKIESLLSVMSSEWMVDVQRILELLVNDLGCKSGTKTTLRSGQ